MGGPGVTWGSLFWLKFSPVVRNALKITGATLFRKFVSKKTEILVQNRPKSAKMEFFDLDFSDTKNGQGKKFQEHLW